MGVIISFGIQKGGVGKSTTTGISSYLLSKEYKVLAVDFDSQGNLTGYDIEVARAVFKKLPQYKVKFQVTDFSGISPGIDSGRYQMGANDFGWEKSRAEKYYFSSPLSK